ncbi:alpha/beta hydrolase [Actinoplanes sp. CA-054009]
MTTFVLVHGTWHQAGTWRKLEQELRRRGYHTVTPQLPSAGIDPTGDVQDDATAIRRAIEVIDDHVMVVAHSYGGIPVTEAVTDADHITYVAAYVPDTGESMYTLHGMPPPDDTSGFFPRPADPRATLYGDLSDEDAAAATAELVDQTLASVTGRATRAAWHDIPSAYVATTDDRSVPVRLQSRLAERVGAVRHLASSHSPHLSRTAELATILDDIVNAD